MHVTYDCLRDAQLRAMVAVEMFYFRDLKF